MKLVSEELRKGNIVRIDNDFLHISGINGNKLYFGNIDWDIKNAHPVPISEQWLNKLHWDPATENSGTLPCFKKSDYTIARWSNKSWKFWIGTMDISNSPQYLHQLQNLYFDLCGEVLIKNELILTEMRFNLLRELHEKKI